jgi:2-dehydro-3-deoxy-D-arabinonate dehydratase
MKENTPMTAPALPGLALVRFAVGPDVHVAVAVDGSLHPLDRTIGALLALPLTDLRSVVEAAAARPAVGRTDDPGFRLLPPVDGLTEVWASGVTYRRSSDARQEESQVADVYARVYDADRPELFFKSVAWRACGPEEPVGVRRDSEIDVPEPELALVCNAHGEIVGLTICDDVSSRSIEGENPLYLPQAKVYSGSCALGPGIVPVWHVTDPADLAIGIVVTRDGEVAWSGKTSTSLMHRDLPGLVEHLFRQSVFPQGAVLSTGTGLVPDLTFSLTPGDRADIEIDQVGRLGNPVREASAEGFAWLTPDPARVAS